MSFTLYAPEPSNFGGPINVLKRAFRKEILGFKHNPRRVNTFAGTAFKEYEYAVTLHFNAAGRAMFGSPRRTASEMASYLKESGYNVTMCDDPKRAKTGEVFSCTYLLGYRCIQNKNLG
jgi:hypothetical protein